MEDVQQGARLNEETANIEYARTLLKGSVVIWRQQGARLNEEAANTEGCSKYP
jgi:hypothetical protein